MNLQDKKQWVVIGVIVIALACLAAVMIFGGGAAFLALKDQGDSANTSQNDNDQNDSEPTKEPTETSVIDSEVNLIPFKSVVQIFAYYLEDGEYYVGWTGSGTIISADGLILTNAHVVLPDKYFPVDALSIALTIEEDQLPVETYLAEVLQADEDLDLAVLQIEYDLDWNPVIKSELNLPFVPQGDANELTLGDSITILGYPGIGGATITLTSGEVSGFTQDGDYGDRAFIKTSATIAGGNSGGLAVDSHGRIIGVPTQLGYGGDDQYVDCRVLADTNKDGYINDLDSCIPTGGFINALRPINLAIPLIEAAANGEVNVVRVTAYEETNEIPEESEILFEDNFDPPDPGWYEWDNDISQGEFVNGDMNLSLFEENYFTYNNLDLIFTDVILSTYVHIITPAGDASYGLICRYQDENNFYSLEISEDGYFSIWLYLDGEFEALYDWEQTDYIPSSGSYEIAASCIGNELGLAVDGHVLAYINDNTFSSGGVGMIIETYEIPAFMIAFEDYIVFDGSQ
jgi:S1-C subfamily serine protease